MVTLSKLGIKANGKLCSTIKINDVPVEVKQYLPIDDKLNLIDITIQQSWQDNIINPVLLEKNYMLNIIFKYTNLSFTDKQREDKGKLYDMLKSNDIINYVLAAIPKDEFNELNGFLEEEKKLEIDKKYHFAPQLGEFLETLPKKMRDAAEAAKEFNPEQYNNVMNFVQAANGGRPV